MIDQGRDSCVIACTMGGEAVAELPNDLLERCLKSLALEIDD